MRQFGARAFDFDIDTGTGVLLPPEDQELRIPELEEAVENAGFELLGVELEVQGRLTPALGPSGERLPSVEVESTGQSFAILEGDSDREHEAWARLFPHLDNAPSSSIWLRGRVHSHETGPTALFVNDFRWPDE